MRFFDKLLGKFKDWKWNAKSITIISVATIVVIGSIVFTQVILPSMGKGKSKPLHIDRYAELDCTEAASEAFIESVHFNARCKGEVIALFHLTMDEGVFTLELDREALDKSLEDFIIENTDAVLKKQQQEAGAGVDQASLDRYASVIGYPNWDAAVKATAEAITGIEFEELTEGVISYSGTYELTDNVATFSDKKGELFKAISEDDGTIVIEYSFDRKAPQFMYDYFKRGVKLSFAVGSEKLAPSSEDETVSKGGITINFILETVPATSATEPKTTEIVETNPDGTPVNPDDSPLESTKG